MSNKSITEGLEEMFNTVLLLMIFFFIVLIFATIEYYYVILPQKEMIDKHKELNYPKPKTTKGPSPKLYNFKNK